MYVINDADGCRSVWKPLSNPVDEWPLAVCDGTTVSRDDLIETDSIRQGNVSSHYYVRYNPDQKWYFLDRQTPDEALIFKHFDTKLGIEASCMCGSSMQRRIYIVLTFARCCSLQHQTALASGQPHAQTEH